MKNIVLIKRHSSVQLGHLYEHLFLRRLNEFFYEEQVFKFLDYAAHGTAYEQAGVVTIDIELYTQKAIDLANQIEQIHIDFGKNNKNISLALHQITAEEPVKLHVTNKQKVIDDLIELDQQLWDSIDTFTLLDTKVLRRRNSPIYLTQSKQPNPYKLHVSLIADENFMILNRSLAPLFNIIARTLLLSASNQITALYGLYADQLNGKPTPLSVTNELLVEPSVSSTINLDSITKDIQKTAHYLFSPETIARITEDLSTTNYSSRSQTVPNLDRILQETDILIGSDGWREIATVDNISLILDHINLKTRYRKHALSRPVRP